MFRTFAACRAVQLSIEPPPWDTEYVPTVLRSGPYRVYFHSHEPNEPPHVHVDRADQSAKVRLIESVLLEKWNERFGG
jgi:hypothetical protein